MRWGDASRYAMVAVCGGRSVDVSVGLRVPVVRTVVCLVVLVGPVPVPVPVPFPPPVPLPPSPPWACPAPAEHQA
ncbi:MAG: hypothetical protein ACXWEI_14345 [Mycobacterium sp.]